jgi:hypothetical protein
MKILKDTQHKDWVLVCLKVGVAFYFTSRISSKKREIKNKISFNNDIQN